MNKFDYLVLRFSSETRADAEELEHRLDEAGDKGYRIVSITGSLIIMEREMRHPGLGGLR